MNNMDKLFESVAQKGPVCIGLDTAPDYVPPKEHLPTPAETVLRYNKAIIDATIDIAACYKLQIAFYEEMGLPGLDAYARTLKYLRNLGALAIADIKRGDIADTAARYARAHFSGDFEADFVTLNPYLGMDTLEPWLQWADKTGKGAFVLMRTSNKGRRDFECLILKEGGSPPLAPNSSDSSNLPVFSATPPRRLFDAVGDKLSEIAASRLGIHGYGVFGAVVGADPQTEEERKEAAAIRAAHPYLFFLIPGYGAQGGTASDASLLLRDGNGGVINASRSILKAWQKMVPDTISGPDITAAALAARQVALEMRQNLQTDLYR